MRRIPAALILAIAVSWFSGSVPASDMYKWTDENGVMHFATSLTEVPERYRDQITTIKGNPAPATSSQPASEIPPADEPLQPPVDELELRRFEVPYEHEGSARRVIIPVTFNDSVTAQMALDTGSPGLVISVDLDHTDWLGPDRESIGREKAGIFRPGRPAVCGDPSPPESLVEHARTLGADLHTIGCEFSWHHDGPDWSWQGPGVGYRRLPAPGMGGTFQYANAAAALMALQLIEPPLPVDAAAVREGIANAWLPARQQILAGAVERVIDVAHNGQAARALAATLKARPPARRTHAVFAMLADKDPITVAGALDGLVDEWHTATLPGPRGQTGERLADGLSRQFPGHPVSSHGDVAEAWRAAMSAARSGDRVVAFGSFLTARKVLGVES